MHKSSVNSNLVSWRDDEGESTHPEKYLYYEGEDNRVAQKYTHTYFLFTINAYSFSSSDSLRPYAFQGLPSPLIPGLRPSQWKVNTRKSVQKVERLEHTFYPLLVWVEPSDYPSPFTCHLSFQKDLGFWTCWCWRHDVSLNMTFL